MFSQPKFNEVRRTFIKQPGLGGLEGILYEPYVREEKGKIGMVLMHSDQNYYDFEPSIEFPKRGYVVFVTNAKSESESFDNKLKHLGKAVDFIKEIPGIEKVLLIGHSGGATLMSAYQAVAENGPAIFQNDNMIIKMDDMKLTPADGVLFLDSNYGNGAMTLISLDPSITDESSSHEGTKDYDLYSKGNGYEEGNCNYSEEFLASFWSGQAERMNKLIDYAMERVSSIEKSSGNYADDEPMTIPGAAQYAPLNKVIPQVPKYLSHTKNEWPLIHADGSVTNQIVPCLRVARGGHRMTDSYGFSAIKTSVKSFLKNSAVRVDKDFHFDETSIYGIDWNSSYTCTVGNVEHISVPILAMGMTGSYEYIAAEYIYEHAKKCKDITVAFVGGASHNFVPEKSTESYDGQWGDTVENTFDYASDWIDKRFL